MRSAFETSRIITYRNGRLSAFGFNKDKRYGFQDGYDEVEMTLAEALDFARIEIDGLPELARQRLGAVVASRWFWAKSQQLSTQRHRAEDPPEAHRASAARRIIARHPVFARTSWDDEWKRLHSLDPEPRPDFAEEIRVKLPRVLLDENDNEIVLRDKEWPEAYLALQTSRRVCAGPASTASTSSARSAALALTIYPA